MLKSKTGKKQLFRTHIHLKCNHARQDWKFNSHWDLHAKSCLQTSNRMMKLTETEEEMDGEGEWIWNHV